MATGPHHLPTRIMAVAMDDNITMAIIIGMTTFAMTTSTGCSRDNTSVDAASNVCKGTSSFLFHSFDLSAYGKGLSYMGFQT